MDFDGRVLNFNEKEINLLEKARVYVEDRDYNKQELERCAFNIQDYIMSHSLKNGDINKIRSQYNKIINILL